MSEQFAENDAGGCHPLMVCTDRPELCPPACSPVVRNAGANDLDPTGTFCEHGHHFQDPEPCEGCWPEFRVIPPAETGGAS